MHRHRRAHGIAAEGRVTAPSRRRRPTPARRRARRPHAARRPRRRPPSWRVHVGPVGSTGHDVAEPAVRRPHAVGAGRHRHADGTGSGSAWPPSVALAILVTSFPLTVLYGQHRQLSAEAAQLSPARATRTRLLAEQQQQLDSNAEVKRLAQQNYQLVAPGPGRSTISCPRPGRPATRRARPRG